MFNIENVQHETEICLGKYKFVAEGGLKAKLATEFVAETTQLEFIVHVLSCDSLYLFYSNDPGN